jgi:CheY-like chemotaxis protein
MQVHGAARRLLPVVSMAPPDRDPGFAGGAAAPTAALTLDGVRILVVDDDADTRRLEKLIFAKAGATVAEAGSADTAIQTFRDFKPHLLVSDVHMPREDGCRLIRRIRALAAELGGAVPAIAVSGGSGSKERREALLAGFSAHLTKPVAIEELLATALALSAAATR